MKLEQAAFV